MEQEIENEENKESHNGNDKDIGHRDGILHYIYTHGSFKEWLGGRDKMMVNSWHHQGVLLKSVKGISGIEVLANTNNVLEGFRIKNIPVVGIQWHPEEFDDSVTIKYIINNFINK